jgi:hypothetical protein
LIRFVAAAPAKPARREQESEALAAASAFFYSAARASWRVTSTGVLAA